jgi:hypothetical protein
VVELEQGGDPRSVFILFLGTHTYSTPDAAGNFVSEPMAGGKYRVRILTTLPDYEIMDTSFVIRAGVDCVIPEPLVLKYTGIPTPENLVVSYDTLNETVIVSWDLPDTALISGYNIYRSIKGQNFSLVTPMPLAETQTVYRDTGLTIGNVYEYRVVSRTAAGEESKMVDYDADTALVASRSLVTTTFTWNAPDTLSVKDSVPMKTSFSNPTRRIDLLEWYVETTLTPVRIKNNSTVYGSDTLVYLCSSEAGLVRFIVKAIDNAGTVWLDTFYLRVILDSPVANGGNDTVVGLNDTLLLHGSATQQFGSIVKWEWKLDSGSWIITSGPDTMIIMQAEHTYICSLAVTDDDGNRAVNSKTITALVIIAKIQIGPRQHFPFTWPLTDWFSTSGLFPPPRRS